MNEAQITLEVPPYCWKWQRVLDRVVYAALLKNGPSHRTQLASFLNMPVSTVKDILHRLKRLGWVKFTQEPTGRRPKRIWQALTEQERQQEEGE